MTARLAYGFILHVAACSSHVSVLADLTVYPFFLVRRLVRDASGCGDRLRNARQPAAQQRRVTLLALCGLTHRESYFDIVTWWPSLARLSPLWR
jgi:hypothetical protein